MKPLFLFVRPPRPVWPFNGAGTAFWPPLGFASLAAALRDSHLGVDVQILDASTLKMGWATVEREIIRRRPAFVGIGEEAVSCADTLRAARIANSIGAHVIAGGCFFANVAAQALTTGDIDVVVHGEGERTIVEVVAALLDGSELGSVPGVSFLNGHEVVFTGRRELIADLDTLPFAAYDLLPVDRYGAGSKNHPNVAAVELGRGCGHSCAFCTLWRQMGESRNDTLAPRYRHKSAERMVDEIRWLMKHYGRRYLGWVDPCFNADPHVPRRIAESLLGAGIRIGQSAWVRTDCLLRDHRSGALRTCVDAGLNEIYLGLERPEEADLRLLNKMSTCSATVALRTISEHYPELFTGGSFIYGLPTDTPERVRDLFTAAHALPIDHLFFIPLTPLPGTPYWRDNMWDATGERFRHFNFLPDPNDARLSELSAALCRAAFLSWPRNRVRQLFRGLLSRDARKRRINRHLLLRGFQFLLPRAMSASARRRRDAMYTPAWYEE